MAIIKQNNVTIGNGYVVSTKQDVSNATSNDALT